MSHNRYSITDDQLLEAVRQSDCFSNALRLLGLPTTGSSHRHYSNRARRLGASFDHFDISGRKRAGGSSTRKNASHFLTLRTEGQRVGTVQLRRSMIEVGVPYVCSECGMEPVWNGKPLVLQVDHRDGNPLNNQIANLRFLDANCHTQTATYGFKRGMRLESCL